MAIQRIQFKVGAESEGKRIDHAIYDYLIAYSEKLQLSRSKIRKLIVLGSVYLNGKRNRIASKILFTGAKIEIWLNDDFLKDSLTHEKKELVTFEVKNNIIYEDEFIIVVNKPSGLPSQPTIDQARDCLVTYLEKYLSTGSNYLGIHHRLDKDTSGVIAFTKKKEVNKEFARNFKEHFAQKEYWAVCIVGNQKLFDTISHGQKKWSIENFLAPIKRAQKKQMWGAVHSGGKKAVTNFELIKKINENGMNKIFVKALPKTGRTHQIRVHLYEMGCPIIGDSLYRENSSKFSTPRLMLHAHQLKLIHPVSKKEMTFKAMPLDKIALKDWESFK